MILVRRNLGLIIFTILVLVAGYFVHDLLFSEPTHQQGLILEKIYVPGRRATGDTPYGGVRRGNYFVGVQIAAQWIAVVKIDNGDTLAVHCHPDHYRAKDVGEVIHFKRYEGEHFHIQYFAHNEEED